MINRRELLIEATASLLFAPAIVRFGSLMPMRNVILATERPHFGFVQRQYVRGYLPTITNLQNTGLSVHEIAAELNKRGWKAMNSEAWNSQHIWSVIGLDEAMRRSDGHLPKQLAFAPRILIQRSETRQKQNHRR